MQWQASADGRIRVPSEGVSMSTSQDEASAQRLIDLLRAHEQDLMRGILAYAQEFGYSRYTSTLEESWRVSIEGLTDSIAMMLRDGAT
jgi:hypothetical protein